MTSEPIWWCEVHNQARVTASFCAGPLMMRLLDEPKCKFVQRFFVDSAPDDVLKGEVERRGFKMIRANSWRLRPDIYPQLEEGHRPPWMTLEGGEWEPEK